MRIAFLCFVVAPQECDDFNISVAGNKMQWNIAKYLSRLPGVKITPIVVQPLQVFPKSKVLFQHRTTVHTAESFDLVRVPFLNLPILKQVQQVISVYREAKKILSSDKDAIFLCYNLYPQVGLPLRWLITKHKARGVAILADPPIDDHSREHGIYAPLVGFFKKLTMYCLNSCRELVVLNEEAARQYAPYSKYIVVNGGIEPSDFPDGRWTWDGKEKNIVYSGALTEYSGIMNLIAAMRELPGIPLSLDIYGDGPLVDRILQEAERDDRVRLHGRVSNKEILLIQRRAWLLVNPRSVNNEIAKVTFPSKILEYMMSGRPILTTRLNAFLNSDYEDIMFYIEGDSPGFFADAIRHVFNLSDEELQLIAKRAKQFAITKSSWENQVKRIYDFFLCP